MYTHTDDYYISLEHLAASAPVSNDGGDPVAARLHLADDGGPVRGFVRVCVFAFVQPCVPKEASAAFSLKAK